MGDIDHTVRWRVPLGHADGAGYEMSGWSWRWPMDGRVWGFDNLSAQDYFRIRQAGKRTWLFVAPDGTEYDTMRDLFAQFRLRLCDCERRTDQVEQMRLVLGLMNNEIHRNDTDAFVDLGFGGVWAYMESYVHWMEQERILKCHHGPIRDATLSIEGRAIRRMLDMTAPGSNIDTSPQAIIARYDSLYPGQRAK